MHFGKSSLTYLLVILIILFLFAGLPSARAQAEDLSPETLSLVMVIDASGSMARTDPDGLRETASRIFIDLLSPDDYLGIITFDQKVEVVAPLQKIETSAAKGDYKERLSGKLDPGTGTDFNLALEAAYQEFQRVDIQGTRPVVLFLTDGDPRGSQWLDKPVFKEEEYMNKLWEIVGDFTREGISIHSVAFSDEIDPDVIRRISTDTRGDYYIMESPVDLAESFFDLLGKLKNRKRFLEETYNLQEGPKTVNLEVNEFTRQTNLVVLNPGRGDLKLNFTPPEGKLDTVEGIKIDQREDYVLVILDQLKEEYGGRWEASISGNGQVRVLGDIDMYIKAWLEEPVPNSQYPVNESVDFRVRVTRGEQMKGLPLKAEIHLIRPGKDKITVPLEEEGEYFTGRHPSLESLGTCEILVKVFSEGQVVSTYASKIQVQALPAIMTDFWVGEDYRLGEEVMVTASLFMGGARLMESADLKLDDFSLAIDYNDGPRTILSLYDSGDRGHGNLRAMDGIYSNRLSLNKEGPATASLLARGVYRGTNFLIEKKLGSFEVAPQGTLLINLSRENFWSRQGGRFFFPLEIENNSSLREVLLLGEKSGLGEITPSRISLEPGEKKTVDIGFIMGSGVELGNHLLSLTFNPNNPLTEVEPSYLEAEMEVLTMGQVFLRRTQELLFPTYSILAVIILTGLIFYYGGFILYRLKVFPHTRVEGELFYWQAEEGNSSQTKKIKLGEKNKDRIVITFNPDNQGADFNLKGRGYFHDLVIKAMWDISHPRFLQGWDSIIKKHIPITINIYCTQPGIIESNGEIYIKESLTHEMKFETGGYIFQYVNPYGKRFKAELEGINLLEGKL